MNILIAGNGNLSLAPGNTHHLAAFGAVKIAVVPVLYPAHKLQKFPVLLVTLVGIPGQTAANGPNHHGVAQKYANNICQRGCYPHTCQAGKQSHAQNYHIQAVCTVAAHHEGTKAC